MFRRAVAPIAVGEVDLAPGAPAPAPVTGRARLLVRDGTRVLGVAHLGPASSAEVLVRAAEQVADRLAAGRVQDRTAPVPPPAPYGAGDVTVVVCTRDRPDLLVDCLAALGRLDPAPGQLLVVDSASTTGRTAEVARAAGVRVVREDVPGLDRARDRGWRAATRPLVAYVDDDARVDPAWAGQLAAAFAPGVGLVTGLVLPAELVTHAQQVFERDGGMAKGYVRRAWRDDGPGSPVLQAHRLGVGANCALRRDVLAAVGGFDPLLDVGTPTGGGGDLEMFARVLLAGWTAVYEPRAFVRHVHRRDLAGWWR